MVCMWYNTQRKNHSELPHIKINKMWNCRLGSYKLNDRIKFIIHLINTTFLYCVCPCKPWLKGKFSMNISTCHLKEVFMV